MRTFPSPLLVLCALSAVLTVGSPGSAQLPGGSASPKEDALSDTARELFAKGVKASEQQKWDQCRASLLAAWSIKKHPQVAGNLAACEAKLGLYRDAAEHVSYFLRELKPDSPPERRALGEAVLKEARAKIATVTVKVDVAGAEVLVDGKSVGIAPLGGAIFLEPGHHTVEARRDLDPSVRKGLELVAGGTDEVSLQVKPAVVVVAPPVISTAGPPPPVPPAEHGRGPGVGWIIATGIGGAVGLGAGVALTVAANGKGSDATSLGAQVGGRAACSGQPAESIASTCVSLRNTVADQNTLSNGAVASFLIGGVFAIGTAGLGIWSASKPKEKAPLTIRVTPILSAWNSGILIKGAW